MSAPHTPGPWKYVGNDLNWVVRLKRGKQTREIQCEGFTDVEADANAHLIAAAPELLEALKESRDASAAMMRWIADHSSNDNMLRFAVMMEQEGYAGFGVRAQTVIAKAEAGR